MNTLYFVKFENTEPGYDVVVFLLTGTEADDKASIEAKGRNLFNPTIVNLYKLVQIDAVCQTPDTVDCFEPV